MSRYNTVGNHKTTVATDGARNLCVTYHKTVVWKLSADRRTITLNTGGWKTNTTKRRMNQAFNQFGFSRYGVYQKNREWFVTISPGNDIPFDGDTLTIEVGA